MLTSNGAAISKDAVHTIEVFGSDTVLIPADMAVFTFSAVAENINVKMATAEVYQLTKEIDEVLKDWSTVKIETSRIQLQRNYNQRQHNDSMSFIAAIRYRITLIDFDEIADLTDLVISLGITEVGAPRFMTSKLKKYRALARTNAIKAAREKAEIYCAQENMKVGFPVKIVDQNPDYLEGRSHSETAYLLDQISGKSPEFAESDTITVSGAVKVLYELQR